VRVDETYFSADLGGGGNIQKRTLKTEVGKGFMGTTFGHGLVGPKR